MTTARDLSDQERFDAAWEFACRMDAKFNYGLSYERLHELTYALAKCLPPFTAIRPPSARQGTEGKVE